MAVGAKEDVLAEDLPGLQSPLVYMDVRTSRKSRERGRLNGPLDPPSQGILGDCWLLAVAIGLQTRSPGLLTRMIRFEGTNARVSFPRAKSVIVSCRLPMHLISGKWSYVGVRQSKPSDLCWALLEKAVCIHLAQTQPDKIRTKRGVPLGIPIIPHYSDLRGGTITFALQLLCPICPPPPQHLSSPTDRIICQLRNRGLFFLEVEEFGTLHSVLLTAVAGDFFIVFDPSGFRMRYPRDKCKVFYTNSP